MFSSVSAISILHFQHICVMAHKKLLPAQLQYVMARLNIEHGEGRCLTGLVFVFNVSGGINILFFTKFALSLY